MKHLTRSLAGHLSRQMIEKARYYRASGKSGIGKWRRVALTAAIICAIALVSQFVLRHLFFYPLKIATNSMQPELATGDKRYFAPPRLVAAKTGDVVLVKPQQAEVELLCRIIATDGDKVSIRNGVLFVNGQSQRQLNAAITSQADLAYAMPETEVRPNFVFCLNDNARNTNDSRLHGIFHRNQIMAVLVKPALFF